ncbi:hypothetical protein AVEN_169240-1 [Araneus ventricosus]|uniref:Uncharacterized protein n=1 Tax=Araneus ventricosus TaxID=182803 RepID=A0A4Y2LQ11_ARAVE|nr:hypothetical protein AVEN_169240-1 [Araneus ventricosus]
MKTVHQANRKMQLPKSTVHIILHKRLKLHTYKIQVVQKLHANNCTLRCNFTVDMLHQADDDENFISNMIFSYKSTFHVSVVVNCHNCRIWGSETLCATVELQHDSAKVDVGCSLSKTEVIGPFFFFEKTINSDIYLDMLEIFTSPLIESYDNVIFQQDGIPPHCSMSVCNCLNQHFSLTGGLVVVDQFHGLIDH